MGGRGAGRGARCRGAHSHACLGRAVGTRGAPGGLPVGGALAALLLLLLLLLLVSGCDRLNRRRGCSMIMAPVQWSVVK